MDESGVKPFPELEYVRASYGDDDSSETVVGVCSGILWIISCLPVCAIIILLIPNIWGIALSVALLAMVVSPFLSIFDTWNTSPEGIQFQSQLKSRYIKWADVIDIRSTRFKHIILTTDTAVNIPVSKDIQFLRLEASVWLHLQTFGMSDRMKLHPEARGFLASLPADIEAEVEWRNTDVKWTIYAFALFILMAAASFSAMYFSHIRDFDELRIFAVLILFLFILKITREWLSSAMSVTLKDGVLSAKTLFGRCEWRIYNIRKVRWLFLDRLELRVNKQRIVIPISREDPNARKLILALIRLLRENHGRDVLPIPTFLQEGLL